jgi:hypothetical protein
MACGGGSVAITSAEKIALKESEFYCSREQIRLVENGLKIAAKIASVNRPLNCKRLINIL